MRLSITRPTDEQTLSRSPQLAQPVVLMRHLAAKRFRDGPLQMSACLLDLGRSEDKSTQPTAIMPECGTA